jgi:hypothetical protein
VGLRGLVDLTPSTPGAGPHPGVFRIDLDPIHTPDVDQDASVFDGVARVGMPTSLDGDSEAFCTSEGDGSSHVARVGALNDQGGEPQESLVPDGASLVVPGFTLPEDRPPQVARKAGDGVFVEFGHG